MKSLLLSLGLLLAASLVHAQNSSVDARVQEVRAIIDEHTGPLEEYQSKLGEHKTFLEERLIVLKYHQTNKEVVDASTLAVKTVETYYNNVVLQVQEYESVWFDQTRNIVAIYTRYGELQEATGGGNNELQAFVDQHSRYLDLLENLKSDLIGVYTDLAAIKNKI